MACYCIRLYRSPQIADGRCESCFEKLQLRCQSACARPTHPFRFALPSGRIIATDPCYLDSGNACFVDAAAVAALDNDYGEHWFDNWHLREPLEEAAAQRDLSYEELLIIDPERFQNGKDGPCHPPAFRKRFWTEVLRSLELSFDLLADEARSFNQERLRFMPGEHIHDLEARIAVLSAEL